MEKKIVLVFHNCLGKPMTAVTLVQLSGQAPTDSWGLLSTSQGRCPPTCPWTLTGALDTPPGPLLVFFGLAISLVCRRLHCGFPW